MEWNEGKSSCLWRERQSFGGSSKGQCVFVCFIQQRVWRAIQNIVMFIYSLLSLSTFLCILPVFFWACELRDFGCRSERNLCVFVHWCVHSYVTLIQWVCVWVWVSYELWHTHTYTTMTERLMLVASGLARVFPVSFLSQSISDQWWTMTDKKPYKQGLNYQLLN